MFTSRRKICSTEVILHGELKDQKRNFIETRQNSQKSFIVLFIKLRYSVISKLDEIKNYFLSRYYN